MAYVPTEAEVKDLLAQAQEANDKKTESQQAEGKGFVNNGQGVVPEEVWKTLPGKTEA